MRYRIPHKYLTFIFFADDSNLFYANKSLIALEAIINDQLLLVYDWLCANNLALNTKKSNFVIFCPPQKKLNYQININLRGNVIKNEQSIKYLGIIIDCHLNWKAQISYLSKKINRNIGAISRLRHFISFDILVSLYYSLLYPFFIYALIIWGNTYHSTIHPLFLLQKKAIRIITFSSYLDHTNPIFVRLKYLNFMTLYIFIMQFLCMNITLVICQVYLILFFTKVKERHSYNTRLASKSSLSLSRVRTNYGKFNIRFSGAKVWNSIDEQIKKLSKARFKKELKNSLLESY